MIALLADMILTKPTLAPEDDRLGSKIDQRGPLANYDGFSMPNDPLILGLALGQAAFLQGKSIRASEPIHSGGALD